ncbi:hypothetical protein CEF21_14710 [Bacillus sp. FJAT-42376]|uniref:hypothetical protein n=1 Tax=Bacillus sp. FJAT-42376 TaxID=2014076 RepID=UPI000F4F906D|nr:hypothetical protein [Bacillus sp. FJAT-42376]AZB43456.1 hypothetical protein CEF21_14710 [Bacillus sp. FJAT-42376]
MRALARQAAVYVIFLLLAVWLLYSGAHFGIQLQKEGEEIYDMRTFRAFQALFPIAAGMLFAVPELILGFWREGRWSINWLKLLIFGLPLAYITGGSLQFLTGANLLPFYDFFTGGSGTLQGIMISSICAAAFGYVLLSCVRKQPC